ncbi:MAG: M67 family metallopeptidase [Spirochaetales bacterium]|jgi:proteasome lid subunit RPN8/RPN11|nr:M67 family metallopeptidase [Spirochaetales bacterium]
MLSLSPELYGIMLDHARAGLPNEACGLFAGEILGDEKIIKAVYCLKNTDQSMEHFSMAPEDQFRAVADIRKKGLALLGNFHSHPSTPARPSEEDIRLAFDPALSYLIISLKDAEPVLKSFLIRGKLAAEEPVSIVRG